MKTDSFSHLTGSDEVGGLRPARAFVSPIVDELVADLMALRRQNELLNQIAEQAIRIGDKLLERACETVSAYREYVRKAVPNAEAVALASRRLAAAVDDLSPLVCDAKAARRDAIEQGAEPVGEGQSA